MKKLLLIFIFSLLTFSGFAQSDLEDVQNFLIGPLEIAPPSLSIKTSPIQKQKFTLREVNIFAKDEKREVDMVALMEVERNYKPREVDIDFAFRQTEKKAVLELSENVQFFDRGSNYDPYTGKLKNPVYKEMRSPLYNDFYSPFRPRRYYSPFGYSPFLR